MALRLFGDRWDSNYSGARELGDFLGELAPIDVRSDVRDEPGNDDRIHDDYFAIERVDGNRSEIFFRAIVKANLMLLRDIEESSFTIASDKLDALDDSLKALQCWQLGVERAPAARTGAWRTRGSRSASMQRWIRGHQIFAALTQGLIVAFLDLRAALSNDDARSVDAAVALAVLLLRGSGASLEYTGDVPFEEYLGTIRPTMTPPLVPDSFSGLLSTDHRRFVALLREMRSSFDVLLARDPGAHARVSGAVSDVYDSHRFVCERLVGASPSIMMSNASKKSGGDQIAKFKSLRMKVFEATADATPTLSKE